MFWTIKNNLHIGRLKKRIKIAPLSIYLCRKDAY
nr:MAG TPA: hypothetical protein [Caudoviricetes sp.]